MQAGVPLQKVNHPAMKFFLEKYIKKYVPDESTLSKTMLSQSMTQHYLKLKK